MIKNNKIYGFVNNGQIFYTKNGENVPSVLFHEFAHIYANNLLDIPRESDTAILEDLEKTANDILGHLGITELVDSDVRYKPLMQELFKKNDDARYDYAKEVFATAMGELFKKIQNDIKPDIETFPTQVKELAKKEYGENVAEKAFNVAKTLCEGFKFENKNIDAMEIRKKAEEYSNEEEKRIAFEEGAKWALGSTKESKVAEKPKKDTQTTDEPKFKNGSIVYFNEHPVTIKGFDGEKYEVVFLDTNQSAEVSENELTDMESEEPKKKQPNKTAKKGAKKSKEVKKEVWKPQFEEGDEFDDGLVIKKVLKKDKKYLVVLNGVESEMTEDEIING